MDYSSSNQGRLKLLKGERELKLNYFRSLVYYETTLIRNWCCIPNTEEHLNCRLQNYQYAFTVPTYQNFSLKQKQTKQKRKKERKCYQHVSRYFEGFNFKRSLALANYFIKAVEDIKEFTDSNQIYACQFSLLRVIIQDQQAPSGSTRKYFSPSAIYQHFQLSFTVLGHFIQINGQNAHASYCTGQIVP